MYGQKKVFFSKYFWNRCCCWWWKIFSPSFLQQTQVPRLSAGISRFGEKSVVLAHSRALTDRRTSDLNIVKRWRNAQLSAARSSHVSYTTSQTHRTTVLSMTSVVCLKQASQWHDRRFTPHGTQFGVPVREELITVCVAMRVRWSSACRFVRKILKCSKKIL